MVRSSDFNIRSPLPTDQCPLCASTRLREALVKSTFWQDDRLVVVENIPAVVCDSCGERYYDDATSSALDIMQRNGFLLEDAEYVIRVPVFSFKSAS